MHATIADRSRAVINTIEVGGRDLFVRRVGNGFPLLMINGLALPLDRWAPLEPRLHGSELIEVDLPGSGRSAANRPPLTMWSYARMVRGLLDVLEIDAADVLGLSFGGMVAQQLALDSPSRIRKLVLASTSCGWGGVPSNLLSLSTKLYEQALKCTHPADDPNERWSRGDPGRTQARQATGLPFHPRAFAHQIVAASTWSSLPWLARLQHEVLVVAGTSDPLVPALNATVLTSWLANARLHLVTSGGHLCVLDRADEMGSVIERFLSG